VWDADTGKEIAQLISFNDGEWLCFTPEGYYAASSKGDAHLNVRIFGEVSGIDQHRRPGSPAGRSNAPPPPNSGWIT
jgi:hypothetical protein